MKRRSFLSCSAVALSAVAEMSVVGVAKDCVSLVGYQHNGYFEVNGTTEDCRKFVESFQTNLWPEWRTHSNDMARRVVENCFAKWPAGVGRVSNDGKQCREALQKTFAQFGNQIRMA